MNYIIYYSNNQQKLISKFLIKQLTEWACKGETVVEHRSPKPRPIDFGHLPDRSRDGVIKHSGSHDLIMPNPTALSELV